MNKTDTLYDTKPYDKEFEAVVVNTEITEDTIRIVLDRTLFFPEQGGQKSDLGTLTITSSGEDVLLDVIDAQISEDVITHICKAHDLDGCDLGEVFSVGSTVRGCINWQHRFSNMQQHSGEHIFSGMVHNIYGYDNVGFHLSDNEVTMDFNGPLTLDQALEIEHKVNEVIASNVEILVSYPTYEELKGLDYRSKKELSGQIRIVTIPDVDVCACCAPHVRKTGEIGFLKLVGIKNYKGGVRINILCGMRALALFDDDHNLVTQVADGFSTSPDKIKDSIAKQAADIADLKAKLTAMASKVMNLSAAAIPADAHNAILVEDGIAGQNAARSFVNQQMELRDGLSSVFLDNGDGRYSYILGSHRADVMQAQSRLRDEFGAKGGGKPPMIQGSLATDLSQEDLLTRLTQLFDTI